MLIYVVSIINTIGISVLSGCCRTIRVEATCNTVTALIGPKAEIKGLALQINIEDEPPAISTDEIRLYQVLLNLMTNAVKYTHEGSVRLDVSTTSCSEDTPLVQFTVSDTGIGISHEDQALIFDSFGQVDPALPGSGLGLAITQRLVRLMGGTLSVQSRINQGATFSFCLPIATKTTGSIEKSPSAYRQSFEMPAALSSTVHSQPTAKSNSEKNTKTFEHCLLIVDDEASNLALLQGYLQKHYRLLLASDAETGFALLQEHAVDLVLLDIMMPGTNGFEFCSQLRESKDAASLPVIMLSAKNRQQDTAKGFQVGANDYLTKPFFRDELFVRLHNQLDLKRLNTLKQENAALQARINALPELIIDNDSDDASDDLQMRYRKAIVNVMNSSIDLWVSTTGKDPIQLAETSKIWSVALDGSRMRARSMEKYLNTDKLPKNPRWREVAKTAHFVHSDSRISDKERQHLQGILESLLTIRREMSSKKPTKKPAVRYKKQTDTA
ncbi:Sensory/regulatory protein RpfC [BD1-7 clade bacterium]|uniref:histidine kinase n=1 Tax=BD1-7 clade bacterium TaxID=2029982 RepID=A0A5S9QVK5_9GAMM|nr:Sensory/regulatory protein RpfC [BD1-7 clade bacterium]